MRYKIFNIDNKWAVYSGYYHNGLGSNDWIKEDIQIISNSISDCYTWIKAKQEGLMV